MSRLSRVSAPKPPGWLAELALERPTEERRRRLLSQAMERSAGGELDVAEIRATSHSRDGDGGPWGCRSDGKLQGSSGRSCHWTCFMAPLRGLASVFGDKEIATSLEGDSEAFAGRISGVDAFGDRVGSRGEHRSPLSLMHLSIPSLSPSIHPQSPWLRLEQGEGWRHRVRSSLGRSP